MAKSKGKKKIVFIFLAVLAVAGWVGYGKYAHRVIPVSISKEKAARRNITEVVVANGKIEPVVQVKISPEVSGEIIELAVKEGQHVKKGDLLFKIKPDNYVAARNSAEANYKSADGQQGHRRGQPGKGRPGIQAQRRAVQGQADFRIGLS